MNSKSTHKKAFISLKVLMGVAGAGALSLAWWFYGGENISSQAIRPLFAKAEISDFSLEIIEPGEIESAENIEINCEVRSRSSGGVSILEIVPEGTLVKKGDFLVRLDDAALQKDLLQQRISVHQSKAALVKATADVEGARLALEEYLSGSFRESEEQLESAEFVAKENMRRAEEYLVYSQKLSAKGYVSSVQLDADQFAVEKAKKELDLAQTKLEVLRVHTRKAKVTDLNASIKTSEARLQSAENSFQLEKTREKEIEEQIKNCTIYSPSDGEVTYANKTSGGSQDGVLIEEGKQVRERQTIIRLPDPSLLRVVAKINENKIEKVRPGMKCFIKLDAIRDLELSGVVDSISEYPLASMSRYTSHIKEYATEILISSPPEGIRTGMTAQVTILADHRKSVLQIPITCVFRDQGTSYCLIRKGETGLERREIKIGPFNMTHAVVLSGVKEGEEVVLNPGFLKDDSGVLSTGVTN